MAEFEILLEDIHPVVVIPPRVDVTNTHGLLNAVRGAMGKGSEIFIFDLSATEAIDSTALGAIVSLYKSLRVGEGDLVLASVQDGVRRILALTSLDKVFAVYSSVSDAKAAVQQAK